MTAGQLDTPSPSIAECSADSAMPQHVGVIMDGNGRWAAARGLPRTEGHRRGVEAVKRLVRAVSSLGIPYLTLFSFSSENWSRPASEVNDLLGLLKFFIKQDLKTLKKEGVRVRIIGSRLGLAPDILDLLDYAEKETQDNHQLTLVVAFNYGGRDEIVRAAQHLAQDVASGKIIPSQIDAARFSAMLDTCDIPDPDVIIRTSGEQRISNFLLWQSAYTEFVFSPVLWPDFDEKALHDALKDFQQRQRRFGGIGAGEKRSAL